MKTIRKASAGDIIRLKAKVVEPLPGSVEVGDMLDMVLDGS